MIRWQKCFPWRPRHCWRPPMDVSFVAANSGIIRHPLPPLAPHSLLPAKWPLAKEAVCALTMEWVLWMPWVALCKDSCWTPLRRKLKDGISGITFLFTGFPIRFASLADSLSDCRFQISVRVQSLYQRQWNHVILNNVDLYFHIPVHYLTLKTLFKTACFSLNVAMNRPLMWRPVAGQ